jgi:hypothetical protein
MYGVPMSIQYSNIFYVRLEIAVVIEINEIWFKNREK